MSRVLKWSVPVDDDRYAIGGGEVALVACQRTPDEVQVWTIERDTYVEGGRTVRVYGTGMTWDGTLLGSCMALDGGLVWHLVEVAS